MKEKGKCAVSIIGGADGPTSVFVAGRMGKRSLRECIRRYLYKCRKKRMKKRIIAGAHTLEEVVTYAKRKYQISEISKDQKKYIDHCKNLKENLVLRYKPELLGELGNIRKPDVYNEDAMKEMYRQIQLRSERAANISDQEMPMNFHVYEIRLDKGHMEIDIDYTWEIFGISYGGNKKVMKLFRKIAKDLYIYYGVTQEDIRKKSERYSSLLATLSS